MKHALLLAFLFALLAAWSGPLLPAALGTGFSYQGSLTYENQPANGSFDFEFRLYPENVGGVAIGGVNSQTIEVTEGIFTALIDFGLVPFNDQQRWLEIRVRPAGDGEFATLLPRQLLTSTPYALRAASVAADSITEFELADGAVTAAGVDSSSVQLRVTGECPPGSSIRDIMESGDVVCEIDDAGGGGLWMTDTDSSLLSTTPVKVETNGSPSLPNLTLVEDEADYVRMRFRNTVNTDRHWTLAANLGAAQSLDRFNFFNPAVGDVFSLTGDGWVGAGTSAPVAPFAIQSDGFWRPESGSGYGDFFLGNGFVGLSMGVALAGGGAGSTRIWTHNSQPMFFGNDDNGMLLTIGNNAGTTLQAIALQHLGPGNRVVEVEPDGDLVATSLTASLPAPASVFGQFGGDGRDGVFVGQMPRYNMQFTEFHIDSIGTYSGPSGARYLYIGVQGRCKIEGTLTMAGRAGNARLGSTYNSTFTRFPGLNGSDGVRRNGNREGSDLCHAGSGGAGGSVDQISAPAGTTFGGHGGGSSVDGGDATDPKNGGLSTAFTDSYLATDDNLLDLLRCTGGSGGDPALYVNDSVPVACNFTQFGGNGGGVIYLECGEFEFTATGKLDVSGEDGSSANGNPSCNPPPASGGGGGGGGGVILVRTRKIIANNGTYIVDGGQGSPPNTLNSGGVIVTGSSGGDGGKGIRLVVELP